jgi:hypothetical protein
VGTVRKFADGRFPNVAWDFSFTMDHKATNWREKQEKQAQ